MTPVALDTAHKMLHHFLCELVAKLEVVVEDCTDCLSFKKLQETMKIEQKSCEIKGEK